MSTTTVLLIIVGTLLVGAISPGPSFVLVSRVAMAGSRLGGLAAALGMGLGGALFGALALVGLSTLLLQVDWLYLVLKVAGGAYLIYLGIRMWRSASQPIPMDEAAAPTRRSLFRAFSLALLTQLSNPKTAVVYASIFAALLPPAPPSWLMIVLPPLIFAVEASWYALVALVFSANRPRSLYLGSKTWIDRAAGSILGVLGARLVVEGVQSRVS